MPTKPFLLTLAETLAIIKMNLVLILFTVFTFLQGDAVYLFNNHLHSENHLLYSCSKRNVPIIDLIQDGEYYSIKMSSQGCFHSYEDEIAVENNDGVYTLSFNAQKLILNSKQIKRIRKFENELSSIKQLGCTTEDKYTITYNSIKTEIIDGSCRWNGLYNLKKDLNLIKE